METYEDLFIAYTLAPCIVKDSTDLSAVVLQVLTPEGWVTKVMSHTSVWDYNKADEWVRAEKRRVEQDYFERMETLTTKSNFIDQCFKSGPPETGKDF